jgi:hypothetical protein
MVRRLRSLPSGLGLTALLVVALGCIHHVGLAMVSPLAATEQWSPPEMPPAPVPTDPQPFEPSALISQPLFAMTRIPPQSAPSSANAGAVEAPPLPPVEPLDTAPPDYILAGIMISGSNQRVLLKKHKTEKGLWVSRGQITGDGWTVLTVNQDKATIARSNRQFTLQFRSYMGSGSRI